MTEDSKAGIEDGRAKLRQMTDDRKDLESGRLETRDTEHETVLIRRVYERTDNVISRFAGLSSRL